MNLSISHTFSHFCQPNRLGSTVAVLLLLTLSSLSAAETCEQTLIPTGNSLNYQAALSADGTRIAFFSSSDLVPGSNPAGKVQLFIYDVASSSITQLTHNTSSRSSQDPSINANGTRIVFLSTGDLTGQNPDESVEVFLYDSTTSSLTQLSTSSSGAPFETFNAAISADGNRVVFISRADQTGDNPTLDLQLFLYDIATSSLTQLTHVTSSPPDFYDFIFDTSINQDGTRIAFASNNDFTGDNPDNLGQIFVYDVVSDSFTQVTHSDPFYGSGIPSISGDGTRIAFTSESDLAGGNPLHDFQIFLADLTAGSVLQVTHNSDSGLPIIYFPVPVISLDGTRITFHSQTDLTGGNSDRTAEVYLYDVPSASLTQVTSSATLYSTPWSLSADGTRIAYSTGESGGGLLNAQLYLASCPNPENQVIDLQETVNGFALPSGLTTALLAKLNAALAAIAAGDIETACANLSSFINQVKAQSGKKLTQAQADELIAEAESIKTQIGCP